MEGDSGGGGDQGVMGAGSLQEAGEERVGDGIPKGTGVGRNRKYFAKAKAHRGGNHQGGGGNQEYKVRKAGNSDPPVPPPPHD